jgi:hypothetical protein
LRRRCLRWALAAATAGLVACGPGVGGSGTGKEPDASAGAAPLPALLLHADGTDGRQLQATLRDGRLTVDQACPRRRFVSTQAAQPDGATGALQFVGQLDGDPARPAVAELRLEGSLLQLSLRELPLGQLVIGPVALPARDSLPPLAGC